MKLHIIGSSSAGNGYILESDSEALCIEAGVKLSEFKKALNFQTSKIKGLIVSHRHGDHAKFASDFIDAGIMVYSNEDTISSLRQKDTPFGRIILPKKAYRVGGFTVQPTAMIHDVPCYGYIIKHPELGKLYFATDTSSVPYNINNVNHFLIEANHAADIVKANIKSGEFHLQALYRLMDSHMELQETKEFLSRQDLVDTQNIVLIHLSSRNSDEKRFEEEIRSMTGIPTVIAKPGIVIDLSQNPY